jgi:hypothetical protein
MYKISVVPTGVKKWRSIMAHIYRIATLNINGITSWTKMAMLADFVTKQDIDVLLQEVSIIIPIDFGGYIIHHNIGTSGMGTAILTRSQLELRGILQLPSRRGMVADMQGVWLVNVYALSGAGKRQECKEFFNLEVPHLLRLTATSIILGGDFNCVLENSDSTRHCTYSRALTELVRGFHLVDVWAPAEGCRVYTHYACNSVMRLDRIYVTRELLGGKRGTETIVTALSDHLAVLLRMALKCDYRPTWQRAL